jgi:hypothetical protein
MDPNNRAMKPQSVALHSKIHVAGFLALVLALVLIAAPAARAQNETVGQINVDYSYLRANSSGNGGTFSGDGGTILAGLALRGPISIVGEFQGYTFRDQPTGTKGQMLIYVFGPELQAPIHHSRWALSADVLFGGGYLRGENPVQTASENAFVFDFGPGIIANFHDRFSVQVVKVEYLMTNFERFNGAAGRQNDMRISTGFTFNIRRRDTYR